MKGLVPHGSTVDLPVLSGSMAPLIMPGSSVRIRSCRPAEIKTGDIIVFKNGNSLTIHRLLIRIPFGGGLFIYQKGDANRFGSWIRSDRVVGVVDAVQDGSGPPVAVTHTTLSKTARKETYRQLGYTVMNMILELPRGIKQWLRKR